MNFLTICLNPVIQRTYILDDFKEDEVNRCQEYRIDASGKGVNVTRVLAQLHKKAVHLTIAGGHFRDYFLDLCRQDDLTIDWVESGSEIRTCCTLLNNRRSTSTELVEEARPVRSGTEERVRNRYLELLPLCDWVIISGSKAAGFSQDLYPWMVQQAKQQHKKVVLDVRGPDLSASLPYVPDIIKPNYQEYLMTFFDPSDEPSQDRIKKHMLKLFEQGIRVVLTHGASKILYTDNHKVNFLTPESIQPVNTIGSGDAFTAGMTAEYDDSGNFTTAVQKGMACATANASHQRPGVIY
ncbi:tagatose-6-phosphate kinase [candidate division KSB1 bacterium]|nr:tagatose-6-phosphate kinase [candidate division KSB1 bacterium]